MFVVVIKFHLFGYILYIFDTMARGILVLFQSRFVVGHTISFLDYERRLDTSSLTELKSSSEDRRPRTKKIEPTQTPNGGTGTRYDVIGFVPESSKGIKSDVW